VQDEIVFPAGVGINRQFGPLAIRPSQCEVAFRRFEVLLLHKHSRGSVFNVLAVSYNE